MTAGTSCLCYIDISELRPTVNEVYVLTHVCSGVCQDWWTGLAQVFICVRV